MKIPFDIKYRPQIESGEYKVETKDGRQARIVSWDKNGFECTEIVVLVTCATGTENCNIYTDKGLLRSNPCQENMQLFIVTPKEELTPFEEELATIIGFAISQSVTTPNEEMATFVKEWSGKLLSAARQQLTPKFGKEYEDGYLNGFEDGKDETLKDIDGTWKVHCKSYDKGYDDGKKEALKDLPRWRKIPERNQNYSDKTQFVINGRYLEMSDTLTDVYEVSLSDLEKLPKFKED